MALKIKNDQLLYPLSGSFSGSFSGSINNAISASYALTASHVEGIVSSFPFTGSAVITGSLTVTGSLNVSEGITGSLLGTASYALTASYLENYIQPFPFTGSAQITGSLGVTGSLNVTAGITGSLLGTASFATNAITASYVNPLNQLVIITGSLIQGLAGNIASGEDSHAEGSITKAIGNYSHAEGDFTQAKGDYSHAEGQETTALGQYSHAEGWNTIASANHQHVQGQWNITSSVPAAFIVGNGTDDSNRSNLIFAAGNSVQITGSLQISGSITGSLFGTASFATTASFSDNTTSASYALTSSFANNATSASYAANSSITYVSSSNLVLSEIEVADFDNNVAVTYVNGRLKFIFGTPIIPSAPVASFNSTFLTDRFNAVSDNYTVTGTITINGYTLISASLFEGSVLLASTGSGATSLIFNTTTTGSHTYSFQVTASSPLDGSINQQVVTLVGTLNKVAPGAPTITPTATVQLGASSNQIEQGATGSITFVSSSGANNGWVPLFTTSSLSSPIFVTGSLTGSLPISVSATSYYSSSGTGGSDNNPPLTTTSTNSFTYTKIRSLRFGASVLTSFSADDLSNLALWDTTLGGSVGTISKGTTNPNNFQFTANTSAQYIYIVYDSSFPNLTGILNVNNSNSNDLSVFSLTTVGNYKVYRSNNLSSTSILYRLTTS